jgi:type I restriction enzyme S subunit
MVGATSTHLNLKDLRKMLVPIPPKALQEDFESKIKAIRRLSSSAKAMDDGFESLFSSLQSRAFSGQL